MSAIFQDTGETRKKEKIFRNPYIKAEQVTQKNSKFLIFFFLIFKTLSGYYFEIRRRIKLNDEFG